MEICEEACREDVELEIEETDDESNCDEDNVSLVGLRVVAIDPLEAIMLNDFRSVPKGGIGERRREERKSLWNGVRDVLAADVC